MLRMVPRSASAREIKGFPSATCCSGRTPRLRARDRSARAIRPTNIRTGVDGQQRLTSLYAVFRGKKVVDSDYRERARNPESPSAEALEVQSACSQLPGRRGANDFFSCQRRRHVLYMFPPRRRERPDVESWRGEA